MSYFATFYSYKGGVGRTLALANVAWLLANHPSEPARVLVLDFDLGAPGLYEVFGMTAAKKSLGIVDYVCSYLQKAKIPSVSQYIHKTTYQNIDIMPAGKMDSRYQRRLESINWHALYEGAFGYELIERLKTDISAIEPEYDYVLVDSLTGYTDVGGVCVNQLPDSLILLFRLNQQNLDGIEKVYLNALPTPGEAVRKSVIPVITPSWPFIDEAATRWISKAQRIFPKNQLLEISFDSSLSFGEKIISKEASKLPFAPKLVVDYQRLAAEIREKNPHDCLTIWKSIQRGDPRALADPAELYIELLKRRPHTLEYWRSLSQTNYSPIRYDPGMTPQGWEKLKAHVDREARNGNKFALLASAGMHNEKNRELNGTKTIADLDRAIQIDPLFYDALLQRGIISYQNRRYKDAVRDLSKCVEITRREGNSSRPNIEVLLAYCHLELFDGKGALRVVKSASEKGILDPDLYRIRARAQYLEGHYSEALVDARQFAKLKPDSEVGLLLPSQILAAMGREEEAAKELGSILNEKSRESDANVAEAYLAVDPRRAITLLTNNPRVAAPLRILLVRIAKLLSGVQLGDAHPEPISGAAKIIKRGDWTPFEVIALLRAKERAGQLSAETIKVAYNAIQESIEATEPSFIPSHAKPRN